MFPVDRDEYVSAARSVIGRRRPFMSPGKLVTWLMPGGGRRALQAFVTMKTDLVAELRALDLPPEDRSAIERHFIEPLAAQAFRFQTRLESSAGHRMGWRKALEGPDDFARPKDEEFCISYGLADPPKSKAMPEAD